jgi:2-keto-3-deoxy-L-rhamnonate aldolase RhmA
MMATEVKGGYRPRHNRILEALKKGDVPLGMEVNTGDPTIIEILAYTGFDFIMLDTEHSRLNPETVENCIRAADAAGMTTIVRVPENSATFIRHAQEAGAQGIVVPHVESPGDVQKIIDSVRYGPAGKCGVCPSVRAAGFSSEDYEEYTEHSNRNTMIIPLLEDRKGFEYAAEIFDLLQPGVDAIGTGMGDLAFSLTVPGQETDRLHPYQPGRKVDRRHPYIMEAAARVAALSKKTGVPIMDMAFSPESARETLSRGTKILLYAIDQLVFYETCKDIVRSFEEL